MKYWRIGLIVLGLMLNQQVLADIEAARQLMEQGKFVQAREMLLPAAQAGPFRPMSYPEGYLYPELDEITK